MRNSYLRKHDYDTLSFEAHFKTVDGEKTMCDMTDTTGCDIMSHASQIPKEFGDVGADVVGFKNFKIDKGDTGCWEKVDVLCFSIIGKNKKTKEHKTFTVALTVRYTDNVLKALTYALPYGYEIKALYVYSSYEKAKSKTYENAVVIQALQS